jgi:hypothetical protein
VATVEGTANQRQMDCNYQSRRFAPFVKFITTDFSVICLYNLVKFSKMFGCVNFPAINIYFVQQRLNNKKEVSSLLLRLLLLYLIIIIIIIIILKNNNRKIIIFSTTKYYYTVCEIEEEKRRRKYL